MPLENLLRNCCPKCGDELNWDKDSQLLFCDCGVRMSEDDFKEAINKVHKGDYHIPTPDENLSALNNWGR
jgi:tRNA(Ile2) C34 agmatinyltransferase TiaS